MRNFKKAICKVMLILTTICFGLPAGITPNPNVYADTTVGKAVTILFTHDMHDHFLPVQVKTNGVTQELGGYARLASAIAKERAKDPNLLLLDGGDFSMGTLFQSIYSVNSPGLRTLGMLGYDAVTLGNHEFDFRPDGLAQALNAAKGSGDKLPQIVASNITFPLDENGLVKSEQDGLHKAMGDYGVKEYTVLQRDGLKIGIFGLMGKDAIASAPMAGVEFKDEVDAAKTTVEKLRSAEKVDLVVCLSHSGTNPDKSKSEDEILAKEVPGIDFIVSGHTHTKLDEPIQIGNTTIGGVGEYGENLGVIKLQKSGANWKFTDYHLDEVDNKLPEDPAVSGKIAEYKKLVENNYLSRFGLQYDEVLAHSSYDFIETAKIGARLGEEPLGNLIADSYIYAVKKAEGADYVPIDVAIEPVGTIRGSFVKGDITVSDAFTVSSLGIGADKVSGYPLISVYLTGKELKTACEVDASIAPMMSTAQLYMSGLSYTFNPHRLLFSKVTRVEFMKPDGSLSKVEDGKLYRVVVGLYSAQMLSIVGKKSFGLLSIVPKTKDGIPIEDYEAQIIKDKTSGRDNEVKEWLAVAEYLKSFDKAQGVPLRYSKPEGRKVVDDDSSIVAILAHPNNIMAGVLTIALVLISLIAFVVYRIATRKKRRSRKLAGRIAH